MRPTFAAFRLEGRLSMSDWQDAFSARFGVGTNRFGRAFEAKEAEPICGLPEVLDRTCP